MADEVEIELPFELEEGEAPAADKKAAKAVAKADKKGAKKVAKAAKDEEKAAKAAGKAMKKGSRNDRMPPTLAHVIVPTGAAISATEKAAVKAYRAKQREPDIKKVKDSVKILVENAEGVASNLATKDEVLRAIDSIKAEQGKERIDTIDQSDMLPCCGRRISFVSACRRSSKC